jgi:hypothetical protein
MQQAEPLQIRKGEVTTYLRLQFESGHRMMVETPGTVIDAVYGGAEVDPARADTLLPVLRLMRRPVAQWHYEDDESFVLRFDDATELRFDPHPRWESWTLWMPMALASRAWGWHGSGKMATFQCHACGYPALDEPPRSENNGGSYEICPSCGFEFGYTDDDQGWTYAGWREKWIAGGMEWASAGIEDPPLGWNPREQLESLPGG